MYILFVALIIETFMSSLDILKSVIELCSPFVSSYRTSLGLLLKTLLTQVESKVKCCGCTITIIMVVVLAAIAQATMQARTMGVKIISSH